MALGALEARLQAAIARHGVPGASLAILADGRPHAAAAGVLHRGTGVQATTAALFQLGSIGKVYTTTQCLCLNERGLLDLDAPVADVLPGFRVADPAVSQQLTPRHLLTHTSGLAGDAFVDAGRGDDVLERCLEAYLELGQDAPMGTRMSYCNSGFVVLGRIVEVLTGQVWDAALRADLLDPLGLDHTWTLPEDLLRFRTALGHLGPDAVPAPVAMLPRSLGPAGLICATASDLVAFAAMHLREPVLAAAREPQADVRDLSTWADAWGLGWMLFDWDGCRVFGHDGVTIGQHAFLRVVPEHGVAIALLTNGGMADDCFRELCGDLLAEVCGLRVPAPPEPAADVAADETLAGVYEHVRMRLTIVHGADGLVGRAEALDGLDFTGMAEVELDIRPLAAPGRYVVRGPGVAEQGHAWCPIGFPQTGGERYAHFGGRAMRRVA
jgi:CubicO group peptidase (beta-lactamase class C family)